MAPVTIARELDPARRVACLVSWGRTERALRVAIDAGLSVGEIEAAVWAGMHDTCEIAGAAA